MGDQNWPARPIYSRRRVLALGGSAAVAAAILAACGSDGTKSDATFGGIPITNPPPAPIDTVATPTETVAVGTAAPVAGGTNAVKFGGGGRDGTVKIGFTVPLTGALAAFGEANPFIIDGVTKLAADGIMLGDRSYTVQIVEKDVQSNSDTAALCAGELINDDAVDIVLAIATPEMVNPVADQCEANGVPCLSTLVPWQSYVTGRAGDAVVGFDWTYHFFWGSDQMVAVFGDMWASVGTDKTVGLLCANDADGNALADATTGLPAEVTASGYTLVDPGRFQMLSDDFSSVIGQMKAGGVEIVAGIATEPDFNTFWTQAKQQGFNPKLVTMAKALSTSSAVEALGDFGDGLASEVWWTPNHPFSSSLTGETSQQLSDEYESSTGKQWTQFVGFVHALFEVCFDVLSRAGSTDKQAIADAAAATRLDTMVGPIAYGKNGLPKNISPTPLVGGQWKKTNGGKFPFELLVVNNKQSPEIPTNGELAVLA
jgi:branched-chain amino acid transport system substrate-binding protein